SGMATYYSPDYLDGYDYVGIASSGCSTPVRGYSNHFGKLALLALRASVWGKFESKYATITKGYPFNLDEKEKYVFLKIPQALIDKFVRKEN
ncbi:MAG: hypothetical protein KDE31_37950, partial [Caldilineaceae bacterium]|nr:hypothetical protein [Caldilineaceae bacterium]